MNVLQALTGFTTMVPTIDGNRLIPLSCADVIKPGSQRRIKGEGLPLPKQPHRRGDIIVDFDIVFPNFLNGQQKQYLMNVLP